MVRLILKHMRVYAFSLGNGLTREYIWLKYKSQISELIYLSSNINSLLNYIWKGRIWGIFILFILASRLTSWFYLMLQFCLMTWIYLYASTGIDSVWDKCARLLLLMPADSVRWLYKNANIQTGPFGQHDLCPA